MRRLLVLAVLMATAAPAMGQRSRTTLLPWRRHMEQRMDRLERQFDGFRQQQQQAPPPQLYQQPPIIIVPPYQQLPIPGDPKQQLPIPGDPKQQLPIPGDPKQQLPLPGDPKQQLPEQGAPKQQLPQQGAPQQQLPDVAGRGPQVLPIQDLWNRPQQYSRQLTIYRRGVYYGR